MPATVPAAGIYRLQWGILDSSNLQLLNANLTDDPDPQGWYLTNNGEGKQLTVEFPTPTNHQEWCIQPITGENPGTRYCTITPAFSKDIPAVSQDVVRFPDQVSLIKNLQVWSFEQVLPSEYDGAYIIRSNLYDGIDGIDPLLGVFVECEDDPNFEIIIQKIPVINPPAPRPVWVLTPVNKK